MNEIMKIVQALEDCNILLKRVTLGVSLLGHLLSGQGTVRASSGNKKRKRNCNSWLWK